jgi:glycosyltransferase involved in cell wall biosynthesis
LELQQRRGITSTSIRRIEHNYAAEHADYLSVLGNEFTCGTYSYAGKPIFPLPVPTPNVYSFALDKDFDQVKNRFLWLGSGGLVHKGLDLVLEVFSELPDHHLTVCGPLDAPEEQEFRQAYYRQLYEQPNIHTVGWVDVSSQQFLDITKSCCCLIYPSCSEGQAGSVVTCLQAGIIPVISYESGVSVEDFGIILTGCRHAEIESAIKKISSKPNQELEEMSRKAREYARLNHTKEKYLEEFEKIVSTLGCEEKSL